MIWPRLDQPVTQALGLVWTSHPGQDTSHLGWKMRPGEGQVGQGPQGAPRGASTEGLTSGAWEGVSGGVVALGRGH